jgi:hypothetical protein
MNMFDRKVFYFSDSRILYSVHDVEQLVRDGVTSPDSIVNIDETLSYRAGDVASHTNPKWVMTDAMFYGQPLTELNQKTLAAELAPKQSEV